MSRDQRDVDRSLRSVFVGNIPYDATEEKLKEVFGEVGHVVNFRLVYDRETGKPKGYGFCEYKDADTAHSAMRNLNNRELNGRTLRVDSAANERTREEFRSLQQTERGQTFESPYGPDVDPEKAPEVISQAVASLPPEQMFELAKQMKQCIQTNPSEARNMLLQNPQLAYALLQALVVMRAVDPNVAMGILHRPNQVPPPLIPPETAHPVQHPPFPDFGRQGPAPAPPMAIDPRVQGRQGPYQAPVADPRRMNQHPQPVVQTRDPRIAQVVAQPTGPPSPSLIAEQEKAQLIMQVLQLTDQEINMLPPDQRQSILLLKEQIARGST
ncbi:Cleavage stimulation factor subunit 2 [Halotydeus destructor]|nr:Cleavage stimulation factor subunit 2 [Halotydeus destructor]